MLPIVFCVLIRLGINFLHSLIHNESQLNTIPFDIFVISISCLFTHVIEQFESNIQNEWQKSLYHMASCL